MARLRLKLRAAAENRPVMNKKMQSMDFVKPIEVVKSMLVAGDSKAGLPVKDLPHEKLHHHDPAASRSNFISG